MTLPRSLWAFIGGALGFGLGAWWRGPPSLPPVAPTPLSPHQTSTTPARAAPLPTDLEGLQKELAACQLAARLDQVQREGLPQPFPPEWASAYRSQADIQATAERAIADCELPLKVARVDCSEAPCLLWLERHDGSDLVKGFLRDCPTWTDAYTSEGWLAQGQLNGEDGSARRYWAVAASPEDWPPSTDENNVSKRTGVRYDEGREALMDAWGAHEPTDQETLEDLRRQLEDPGLDPGTRELMESLADMIEEKVEKSAN